MDRHDEESRINAITERVIGCAFSVANTLGAGFLEKVYENALTHELRKVGLVVEQQLQISVVYDSIEVGYYVADLLVEKAVLVEIKVVKAFDDVHLAQCMNYLRATNLKLCLLINFATPRIGIKRVANNL